MIDKHERAKQQPYRRPRESNEDYVWRCIDAGFNHPKVKGSCTVHKDNCLKYRKWYYGGECPKINDDVEGFCHPDKDGGE